MSTYISIRIKTPNIMSYKVKSALYFFSFLVAITIYYSMDNDIQLDAIAEKVDIVEANIELKDLK